MPVGSVYVIAGEASGDMLGAGLIQNLRKLGVTDFHGVGGTGMQTAGLRSLFPMSDLSVMGLTEVLPRLPKLILRIRQTVKDIIAQQPRVVVTIDSPDFCFRVVQKAKKHCPNTKFIHYVAPTVWAWRPERAEKLAKLMDGVLCLFPFEPGYFTPYGLQAWHVGHPAVSLPSTIPPSITKFCEKYDLIETKLPTCAVLLFGSRKGEIERLGHVLLEAAHIILAEWPSIKFFVPYVPHVLPQIMELIGRDQRFIPIDPQDRYQAMHMAKMGLATSGTVGLELAMLNTPHLVCYKFNTLTYKLAKRLVKTPYMHLVNIILGKRVIPEFLQDACDPQAIATTALDLIANRDGVGDVQLQNFALAQQSLLGASSEIPAHQAAQVIRGFL